MLKIKLTGKKEASNEESRELVPWLVISQAGLYRRLLLLMKTENGGA